jgi:hypothetical protein
MLEGGPNVSVASRVILESGSEISLAPRVPSTGAPRLPVGFCQPIHVHIRVCCFTCSVYMPCLYVLNKIDAISIQELDLLDRVGCDCLQCLG